MATQEIVMTWYIMAIKRHTLHLDEHDTKVLARIAHAETKATGIRVTAAGIVRRPVKEYLRPQAEKR
jgi:hypothetical protein